jgi:DNA-binding cell septation regulator SpoVG
MKATFRKVGENHVAEVTLDNGIIIRGFWIRTGKKDGNPWVAFPATPPKEQGGKWFSTVWIEDETTRIAFQDEILKQFAAETKTVSEKKADKKF